MNRDIAELIRRLGADQSGNRRVVQATIQPGLWSLLLETVPEVAEAWNGSPGFLMPTPPDPDRFPRMVLMGVDLEIDETQQSSFRLWDADGAEVAGE